MQKIVTIEKPDVNLYVLQMVVVTSNNLGNICKKKSQAFMTKYKHPANSQTILNML